MKRLEIGKKIAGKREAAMTRRSRPNHSPAFKANVAAAAITGGKALAKRDLQVAVHPDRITPWRGQRLEGGVW